MTTDNIWIRTVDHRISTALILFLLLVLSRKERKPFFALRAGLSLVVMCAVSWFIRYLIETGPAGSVAQGLGYGVHLLVMSLLYWAAYRQCYHVTAAELARANLLALTIYKLAWNTFKVCAAATQVYHAPALWSTYSVVGSIVSYAVYAAVCIPCWRFYQLIDKESPPPEAQKPMVMSFFVFLLCQIILEVCGRVYTADASSLFLYYVCALMYTMINYVLIIAFSRLTYYYRDNEDMRSFINNKMQYYQMSHEGITSLQIKCHDLKHQIAAIRSRVGQESFEKYISRLEDSIIEYGTVVECGNETINIVLTEKNILCTTGGVKFSYIIDGSLFSFMNEMELYSLFGNALDNALESCAKVSDPHRRMISLKAMARGDMVVLHVENSFEEEPNMVDGMPVTTKKGAGHGFGLRSIRDIAEKHGGVASVQVEPPIFKLTVILRPGYAQENKRQ